MTHGLPSHEHATHMVLTGIDKMPPGSTHMASRNDWPCFASGLDYLRPRGDGIPNGVMLPTYLNNGYGFSGQSPRAGTALRRRATRHDPLSGVPREGLADRQSRRAGKAMCKTTTARLKRCGMRWDADNADPGAPGLAGFEQSDQWKLYWQTRLKPTG